jgi:hypothetical protein
LAQAVTAGLTADPMTRIFGAVIAEGRKTDFEELDRKIMADILKRIRALTEVRNDVIHRTWFVGWASPEDTSFDKAGSWKFKNSQKGAEFAPREHEAVDFDKLSATADELTELINRVGGCMILNQPISKIFVFDKVGGASVPQVGANDA